MIEFVHLKFIHPNSGFLETAQQKEEQEEEEVRHAPLGPERAEVPFAKTIIGGAPGGWGWEPQMPHRHHSTRGGRGLQGLEDGDEVAEGYELWQLSNGWT